MEFETNLSFDDEQLFPELNDVQFFNNEPNLDLKKSPGRESVCSEMSDCPGPSPSIEGQVIDFEALLRENGISLLPEPEDSELNNAEDLQYSEAPSSPAQSVSDVESYAAPSPASIAVAKRTRSSTRVRVASAASLSPVHETEEEPKRNKAAEQAKMNREKKKAYIASLEQEKEELSEENATLKENNERLNVENTSLIEEVAYLKSVLANESTLSNLLQNIPNVEGVRLTTSFEESRKRSAAHDHDYGAPPAKRGRPSGSDNVEGGGVCLHVAGNAKVSLEFCSSCSTMAKGTKKS